VRLPSKDEQKQPEDAKAPRFATHEGAEIRGDKMLVTARKIGKAAVVRRTGNHKASEMVVEKDARAVVLRAYTSTREDDAHSAEQDPGGR